MEKRDSLGRRIPEFDRSAAIAKGNATKKEKYGPTHHTRISARGGRKRTRGYFGTLKDQGKEDELRALSAKAREARSSRTKEELSISAAQGWRTRKGQFEKPRTGVRRTAK